MGTVAGAGACAAHTVEKVEECGVRGVQVHLGDIVAGREPVDVGVLFNVELLRACMDSARKTVSLFVYARAASESLRTSRRARIRSVSGPTIRRP